MGKKKQVKMETYQLADALSTAFGELESLQDEMQNWYDNMPESFQNADKGSQVQEAADALSNVQAVELPDALDDTDKPEDQQRRVQVYPMKRKASRATRRDYAVELLAAVVADLEELEETLTTNAGVAREAEVAPEPDALLTADAVREVIDEVQQEIDEAEGVEFPGMYG